MFSEADPAQEILKNNLLKDLEELLLKSKFVPPVNEFREAFENPDDTAIPRSENLRRIGTATNFDQAMDLIKKAKSIDREDTRRTVNKLLATHKPEILESFFEEIQNYMRLRY